MLITACLRAATVIMGKDQKNKLVRPKGHGGEVTVTGKASRVGRCFGCGVVRVSGRSPVAEACSPGWCRWEVGPSGRSLGHCGRGLQNWFLSDLLTS